MSATAPLLRAIKATLRARGLTYRRLAELLSVSEATVKRDLSKGQFSLRRLDEICTALGLTLNDLMQPLERHELVTQLSEAQEIALISQPKYFVVTYLLVNDWKFKEIAETFRMDENQLIEILLRLDQLRIIEYRPPPRVRKLTARNFAWRKDGPVQKFFVTRFVPEFFQSTFEGPGDAFRFVAGTLSPASTSQFKECDPCHACLGILGVQAPAACGRQKGLKRNDIFASRKQQDCLTTSRIRCFASERDALVFRETRARAGARRSFRRISRETYTKQLGH